MNTVPHNIYIHVPYCMSKCNYCAFFSRACATPDWGRYTDSIRSEIKFWAQKLGHIAVPTVFFGGGTPSLMPTEFFGQIMNCLRENFDILPGAEITLESNPGTLETQRLHEFMQHGVNRLSVGVQSLDDNKLQFLGRRHSTRDALRLLESAQNIGLRVSADFIYGLPGETASDVSALCTDINRLGLTHCSMYELTIEPGTPFGKMNLEMPDNATMADMYMAIGDTLSLPRYEVSNYATPGYECMHNTRIWLGDAYIGIGAGAAGRVYMDGTWYEQLGDGARFSVMSDASRAIEKIITGMRTVRGCRLTDDVQNVINSDWINQNSHLVTVSDGCIRATSAGMLVLDDVIVNMVR